MGLFPDFNFTISTPLPPEEVLKRLGEKTRPGSYSSWHDLATKDKRFYGEFKGRSIQLYASYQAIQGKTFVSKGTIIPVIYGQITTNGSESIIRITVRPPNISMTENYFGFFFCLFIMFLMLGTSINQPIALLGCLIPFAFGGIMFYQILPAYKNCCERVQQYLNNLFVDSK